MSPLEQDVLLGLLDSFLDDSVILEVLEVVQGGKEATVFRCRAAPSTGDQFYAAKVYRPMERRNFRNDTTYQQGRVILNQRTRRAYENKTEFGLFKRALAGLDEARMRQIWLGTWSARDIVAHISGWHREMGPALERLARGERPIAEGVSYDDVDAWNGRFAEAKKTAATA